MKIVENRRVVIESKVLTLVSVRAVAKEISSHLETLAQDDQRFADIKFIARCEDGSYFQSEDIGVFADDSPIALKRVTQVSMEYTYYPSKARVEVELNHGDRDSYIKVSGSDRIWVAGALDHLSNIFASFPPQSNPYLKHPKAFRFALAMGTGCVLVYLITGVTGFLVTADQGEEISWLTRLVIKYPAIVYPIKYFSIWILGITWSWPLISQFAKLWPSIEFQIGPEHLLIEKRRRQLLATTIVLGVLPFSIAVLYDLLKVLF